MADNMIIPIAPGYCNAQILSRECEMMLGSLSRSLKNCGQAAAFLPARLAGAGVSGSFGLRPRPMVLANAERAAA